MKRLAILFLALVLGTGAAFAQADDEGTRVVITAGRVITNELGEDGETQSLPAYLVQVQEDIGDSGGFFANILVNRNDGVNDGVYGDILGADIMYRISRGKFDFSLGGGAGVVQVSGTPSDVDPTFGTLDRTAFSFQAVVSGDIFFTANREAGLRVRAAYFDAVGTDLDGYQLTTGIILPGIGN